MPYIDKEYNQFTKAFSLKNFLHLNFNFQGILFIEVVIYC